MSKANASYAFEPYDILQIKVSDKWEDYSTLRTESDAAIAIRKVDSDPHFYYRIVSDNRQTVKYGAKPAPAGWDTIEA